MRPTNLFENSPQNALSKEPLEDEGEEAAIKRLRKEVQDLKWDLEELKYMRQATKKDMKKQEKLISQERRDACAKEEDARNQITRLQLGLESLSQKHRQQLASLDSMVQELAEKAVQDTRHVEAEALLRKIEESVASQTERRSVLLAEVQASQSETHQQGSPRNAEAIQQKIAVEEAEFAKAQEALAQLKNHSKMMSGWEEMRDRRRCRDSDAMSHLSELQTKDQAEMDESSADVQLEKAVEELRRYKENLQADIEQVQKVTTEEMVPRTFPYQEPVGSSTSCSSFSSASFVTANSEANEQLSSHRGSVLSISTGSRSTSPPPSDWHDALPRPHHAHDSDGGSGSSGAPTRSCSNVSTPRAPPATTPRALTAPPPPTTPTPPSRTPGTAATPQPTTPTPPPRTPGPPGKGKSPPPGKGKSPPPPGRLMGKAPGKAPMLKSAPLQRLSATPKVAMAPKRNGLVNLYWKATQQPSTAQDCDLSAIGEDPFLSKIVKYTPVDTPFVGEVAEERRASLSLPRRVSVLEDLVPPEHRESLIPTERRRVSLYHVACEVNELPSDVLEEYFRKNENNRGVNTTPTAKASRETSQALLDDKRLKMIGILLRKHMMKHKVAENEAVKAIKLGVLRCDYDVVPQEVLSLIRTALRSHVEDGEPINTFVRERGVEALHTLENAAEYCLIHELKIPQIDERLECMMFETAFEESIGRCQKYVDTLQSAMKALQSQQEVIKRFCQTAKQLGNSLNRDSNAPMISRGFQLSGLQKLTETRSSAMPRMSLFHFVLAMMPKEEVDALCQEEHGPLLLRAKMIRSYAVYQECTELAYGLRGVRSISETGKYTRMGQTLIMEKRRKTVSPAMAQAMAQSQGSGPSPSMPIDTDDLFHQKMGEFVKRTHKLTTDIVKKCQDVFVSYKEMGIFLGDLKSVYPPPASDQDKTQDLFSIFHRFFEDVKTHVAEIEQAGLREDLGQRQAEVRPYPDGEPALVGGSGASSTPLDAGVSSPPGSPSPSMTPTRASATPARTPTQGAEGAHLGGTFGPFEEEMSLGGFGGPELSARMTGGLTPRHTPDKNSAAESPSRLTPSRHQRKCRKSLAKAAEKIEKEQMRRLVEEGFLEEPEEELPLRGRVSTKGALSLENM